MGKGLYQRKNTVYIGTIFGFEVWDKNRFLVGAHLRPQRSEAERAENKSVNMLLLLFEYLPALISG